MMGARQGREGEGCDVRAVTVWSLLGAYDWNSPLMRDEGFYEPEVFDVRSPTPRPTALAGLARELATGERPTHPVLTEPGWGSRPERISYLESPAISSGTRASVRATRGRPLLVLGASPTFKRVVLRVCEARGLVYHFISQEQVGGQLEGVLRELQPWAVMHAAGVHSCLNAAPDPKAERTVRLGDLCRAWRLPLLTFSSSFVFGGCKPESYLESDLASPGGAFGAALAEAERHLLPTALVVRTGPVFSPWGWEGAAAASVDEDALVSPAYLPDVLHAALDLLIDGERGLWHLAPTDTLRLDELATFVDAETMPRPAQGGPPRAPEQPNWTLRTSAVGLYCPSTTRWRAVPASESSLRSPTALRKPPRWPRERCLADTSPETARTA